MRAYMMGEWPADADHHQKLSPTAATVGPGGQEWKRPHDRLYLFYSAVHSLFFLLRLCLLPRNSLAYEAAAVVIRLDGRPPGQRLDQQEELLLDYR